MLTTPLHALHLKLGAKMTAFAGYEMPLQYPDGVIREHLRTRQAAGLFDVSHMGQVRISGPGAVNALESLLPADLASLPVDRQVYSLLTNEQGGVRDDLIVTRRGENEFSLVLNAACKAADIAYLRERLPGLDIDDGPRQALLALQGPAARAVLGTVFPEAAELRFLQGCRCTIEGVDAYLSCCGYSGEDGFEISVPAAAAQVIARRLLAQHSVKPAGLGARNSLRLEAGLCLYGHELDESTTPVEAGLLWSIGRARREQGERAGGFPGAAEIFKRRAEGPARRRVGLMVNGKRPLRDGQPVLDRAGRQVGVVSSACYAPSLGRPIAMAYVEAELAGLGRELSVDARGKLLPVTVAAMPFVPTRYYRG